MNNPIFFDEIKIFTVIMYIREISVLLIFFNYFIERHDISGEEEKTNFPQKRDLFRQGSLPEKKIHRGENCENRS